MTTVTLRVSARVTYEKTYDMPDAVFKAVKANLETLQGRELALYEEQIAERYLDFQDDVLDSDDTELLHFDEVKT